MGVTQYPACYTNLHPPLSGYLDCRSCMFSASTLSRHPFSGLVVALRLPSDPLPGDIRCSTAANAGSRLLLCQNRFLAATI
ncbi:hypothetical protein N7510_004386 [Penicillium lagena]|uniref:uncharacterized protein n=1 Tax=Penicillium lagena TaxID=94218 RepID=UPI0025423D81|nr:uncharacterized protein N7510_004386 [Penicillium lagena]KAJ5620402.1 hypothetical protein N7510_004386 [Penicillium lagena]